MAWSLARCSLQAQNHLLACDKPLVVSAHSRKMKLLEMIFVTQVRRRCDIKCSVQSMSKAPVWRSSGLPAESLLRVHARSLPEADRSTQRWRSNPAWDSFHLLVRLDQMSSDMHLQCNE